MFTLFVALTIAQCVLEWWVMCSAQNQRTRCAKRCFQ